MRASKRIVHVLDDLAMGGVTRALKNFEHPVLAELGRQEMVDIRHQKIRATSPGDIAIIHFTANWRKLAWLLELRLRGRFSKLILIEHSYTEGFETHEVAKPGRFRRMLKLAYALVDTVVAVSGAQRAWMLTHRLAPAEKVIAIPQSRVCDDLLTLAPAKRRAGPLRIGAFGRFHKQKGFDLLIQAMAQIPGELAELKIAGKGPDEAELRTLAQGLDHVEFCDPFKSPEAFLERSDVIAIPSRWEAFGLVGTEARAAARPLLAARVDGLEDQIDATAFAHTPNCVECLVNAIYAAAIAPDLYARGQMARQRAAAEFDQMIVKWRTLLMGSQNKAARLATCSA